MANIDQYIEQIENARYGKDVRQAIVNALTAMNQEIVAGSVVSFNERRGHVVSADGDYNINQIASTGGIEGQVPVVNTHGGFTMRDMIGEIQTLGQLSDVNIGNLSNGQVLTYDSVNEEWKNGESSGGTTVVANPEGTASTALNKLQVGDNIYSVGGASGGFVNLGSLTAVSGDTWKSLLEKAYLLYKTIENRVLYMKVDYTVHTFICYKTAICDTRQQPNLTYDRVVFDTGIANASYGSSGELGRGEYQRYYFILCEQKEKVPGGNYYQSGAIHEQMTKDPNSDGTLAFHNHSLQNAYYTAERPTIITFYGI